MLAKPIPVTILTGFLGAGKTTLLNHLLSSQHGRRIAVIENEFGEIGIDHELVINADEEIFEMNNGCLCCSVRGDLIRILAQLLKRKNQFDHILIETTGLADPGPVAQTFMVDADLKERLVLDAIVTVVDARHFGLHVDDAPEVVKQVAFADVVLLNKCDLVEPSALSDIEKRIKSINGAARIHRTNRAEIDPGQILHVGGFDLDRLAGEEDHHSHHHDDEEEDEGHPHHELLQREAHHHHEQHRHDHTVGSVGIEAHGECDASKLSLWLTVLLREKGADIFRTKGVFAVRGNPHRVIFQGVHMLLDAQDGGPWGEKQRMNRLVFIGRHLDRPALNEGFQACLQ